MSSKAIYIREDDEVVKAVEEEEARQRRLLPGANISRSGAVRVLILEGAKARARQRRVGGR